MKKYLTKRNIYIGLFSILYLIVAFSSFFHAVSFFELANIAWMSIVLAFAFEIGQAAVLFSLLTSKKDRNRVIPWALMFMFTLVQIIGNIFSSYKYLMSNSTENLRYFKEPIFIWTDLPDEQATVIVVYLVGALLPIAALLLTSMITNYLSDQEEEKKLLEENQFKDGEDSLINQNSVLQMENQGLKEQIDNLKNQIGASPEKDKEIENLKEEYDKLLDEKCEKENQLQDALDATGDLNKSLVEKDNEIESLKKQIEELNKPIINENKEDSNKKSHFINL